MTHSMTQRGFSLLELLIYLGILSLMSVVLAGSFVSLARGRAQSESRTETQSNARFSLEKIAQDVAAASSVTSPTSASSSALVLVVGGSTVTYDVLNGQLRRTVGTSTPDIVTSALVSVDVPVFSRADNYNAVLHATTTSIRTALTVHYTTTSAEWAYTVTMQGTANIR